MAAMRRACVPILAAALWILVSGSSGAASDVTVEVSPNTIQLAPSESVQVLLIVNNGGGQAINTVTVTWPAQRGLAITATAPTADEIPAGGSAAWTLQVARDQNAFVPNAVAIQVDYKVGASGPTGVGVTSLTIQDRASKAVADLVDLKVAGADTLEGGGAADLYLMLANKSSIPLRLLAFAVSVPSSVTPCVTGFTCDGLKTTRLTAESQVFDIPIDTSVAPQDTETFTLRLTAGQSIKPGSHSIGVKASIAWQEGALLHLGAVATSMPMTFAVLGEKDILSVVGIPSLFLLPGFLVTVTFGLLWKYLNPKTDSVFLQPTTPGFWLVPISASLIFIPIAYPKFPQGEAIILGTYSQGDIAAIWIGAIILGVIAYVVVIGAMRLWARFFIPSQTDSPIKVLEKLGRNRKSLLRPAVTVDFGGASENAYDLYDDTARGQVWVSPNITLSGDDGLEKSLKDRLQGALDANDPKEVAKSIKAAGSVVTLEWQASDTARIKGPTPVPKASPSGPRNRLIQRATV